MGCRGFVRVNGAVIAPGDAIQPVSHVPGGQVQNITIIVLKVCVPSFIFIQPSWSHYFKCNSFLIKSC
jgi:sporulation-control protein spo0M